MFLRRKKWLIDKVFQKHVMLFTFFVSIAINVVFLVSHIIFFSSIKQQGKKLNLPDNHYFFQFIDEQISLMNIYSFAASAVIIAALMFYSLYLSNRIAGPIYRIRLQLNAYIEGKEFSNIQVRKNDYFQNLVETINKAILHTIESSKKK